MGKEPSLRLIFWSFLKKFSWNNNILILSSLRSSWKAWIWIISTFLPCFKSSTCLRWTQPQEVELRRKGFRLNKNILFMKKKRSMKRASLILAAETRLLSTRKKISTLGRNPKGSRSRVLRKMRAWWRKRRVQRKKSKVLWKKRWLRVQQ